MSVSSISSASMMANTINTISRTPETNEAAGPNRDHDDSSVKASTKAALPSGTGQQVDKTA